MRFWWTPSPSFIDARIADFKEHRLSSAGLWVALGELVADQKLSIAERREVFWSAHSPEGKILLVRQDPRFDPNSGVWTGKDDTTARVAEYVLNRTMCVFNLGLVIHSLRKRRDTILWDLSTPLIIFLAAVLQTPNKKQSVKKKRTLWVVCALLGAGIIGVWLYYRKSLDKFVKMRQAATVVPQWAGDVSTFSESFDLENTFLDPVLTLEKPRAKFRGKCRNPSLWLKLDMLVQKGLISRAECFQMFWDAHGQKQDVLVNICPLYSPQHPVWAVQDKAVVNKAENLLTELSRARAERVEILCAWVICLGFGLIALLQIPAAWHGERSAVFSVIIALVAILWVALWHLSSSRRILEIVSEIRSAGF